MARNIYCGNIVKQLQTTYLQIARNKDGKLINK